MTYAIDTNVILDIMFADPTFGPASRDFLEALSADNIFIACDVVWAEASAAFNDKALFRRQMAALGIEYSPMSETAAIRAGSIWRLARATQKSKGSTRLAVVPDFLVGAHAMECADALITRDRGFMRRWFTDLTIADPSTKRT